MAEGIEIRSMTVEEFDGENGVRDRLNVIAELVMSHPKIEEVTKKYSQKELLSTMVSSAKELDAHIRNNVPEQVKLREEIASLQKQNTDLRDTAHDLFLRAGSPPNAEAAAPEPERKRLTPSEITRMLADFPFPD